MNGRLNRHAQALACADRALALDIGQFEAHLHRARAAQMLGRKEIVCAVSAALANLPPEKFGGLVNAQLVGRDFSVGFLHVIYDASLKDLLQKVWNGERINAAEALRLYSLPLEELGALADRRRQITKAKAYAGRGNEKIVTYNVDRNVNYTNVCNVYCKFCAFYRVEKDDDSMSSRSMSWIKKSKRRAGRPADVDAGRASSQALKQWYLDLLAHVKHKFPGFNIHGFSPSEFIHFREVFNEPLEKIIGDFKAAGLGSIPGGGEKFSWIACVSASRRSGDEQ